jgi:hypothetical protein
MYIDIYNAYLDSGINEFLEIHFDKLEAPKCVLKNIKSNAIDQAQDTKLNRLIDGAFTATVT